MNLQNKSLFKEKCLINGDWENSINNEYIEVNNPATMEIIGRVPKCSSKETKKAIETANKAFKIWKEKTAKERSIILKKWHDLILENIEDLAKRLEDPF